MWKMKEVGEVVEVCEVWEVGEVVGVENLQPLHDVQKVVVKFQHSFLMIKIWKVVIKI